jgi:hypothetical protein
MIFRTRKAASVAGMLLVAIGWLTKAPMLAEWTNHGLISVISFLLLFVATFSLLIGALKVQLGKHSRLAPARTMLRRQMTKRRQLSRRLKCEECRQLPWRSQRRTHRLVRQS